MHNTEHGGVGTEAKSQGKGRHDRKTGRFAKHAQAEAQILEKAVDEIYATRLATFFLGTLDAAELDPRTPHRFFAGNAPAHRVFGERLAVIAQRLIQLTIHRRT